MLYFYWIFRKTENLSNSYKTMLKMLTLFVVNYAIGTVAQINYRYTKRFFAEKTAKDHRVQSIQFLRQ